MVSESCQARRRPTTFKQNIQAMTAWRVRLNWSLSVRKQLSNALNLQDPSSTTLCGIYVTQACHDDAGRVLRFDTLQRNEFQGGMCQTRREV